MDKIGSEMVQNLVQSSEQIVSLLRQHIYAGRGQLLNGGRLLPERDLVDILGVSRRLVRQALHMLESEGLLVRRQGHGTFVRPQAGTPNISVHTSPAEILEIRRVIEPALAKLAAFRAPILSIEKMTDLLDKCQAAKTGSEYEEWDTLLHREIAIAAQNQLFKSLFDSVTRVRAELGWSTIREATFSVKIRGDLSQQHADIVTAIRERNPAAAELAMTKHLLHVTTVFGLS